MATTAQRLAEVQGAISKIVLGAQSVQFGDRRLQRADLEQLRALEKDLRAQLAAENRVKGGRGRITYVVPE